MWDSKKSDKIFAHEHSVPYICIIINYKRIKMEIELRDKKILDLNNSGKSIREIAKEMNIGKSTVSRVLSSVLAKDLIPDKKKAVEIDLNGSEEKITSFSGLTRTNVNEYLDEKTGEIIRVAFVKAKNADEFGYFVKLGNSEKINSDNMIIKEAEDNLKKGRGVKI